MGDTHTYLPRLTVNTLFIRDLMAAKPPCFPLAMWKSEAVNMGSSRYAQIHSFQKALPNKDFVSAIRFLGLKEVRCFILPLNFMATLFITAWWLPVIPSYKQ